MSIIEDHRKNEYSITTYSNIKYDEHQKLNDDIEKWLAKGNQIKHSNNTNKSYSFNPKNDDAIHARNKAIEAAKKRRKQC